MQILRDIYSLFWAHNQSASETLESRIAADNL